LELLTIGNNVSIGSFALFGCVELESFTLGSDTTIGDFAFYNVASLKEVDLSNVKSVGMYAFSGAKTQDLWWYKEQYTYAYDFKKINGELVAFDYMYSTYAPVFESVDLSAVEFVGEGAFSNNRSLKSVVIGANIGEVLMPETGEVRTANKVPYGLFAECSSLTSVELPATVSAIGSFAFYRTGLQSVNLENVDNIGTSAFVSTALTEVTLKSGVVIGDGAFMYCEDLATVNGLDKAAVIGAASFGASGLTEVVLTDVVEIGDLLL
jgi:hypothetical protein